jgi:hypothetical protein
MIWPVFARYLVACSAGYAWAIGTTPARVLLSVALFACLARDVRGLVYAASGSARARSSAWASLVSIVRSAWRATRSKPRTRNGASP